MMWLIVFLVCLGFAIWFFSDGHAPPKEIKAVSAPYLLGKKALSPEEYFELSKKIGTFRIVPYDINLWRLQRLVEHYPERLDWEDVPDYRDKVFRLHNPFIGTEEECEMEIKRILNQERLIEEQKQKRQEWIKNNTPREIPPFKFGEE